MANPIGVLLFVEGKMDNGYCVYLHKTKEGVVFYVGSGRLRRAYKLEKSETTSNGSNRGKRYSEYVKNINFEYDVEIVICDLSKEASLDKETELYDIYLNTIVNRYSPRKQVNITKEMFIDYLYYDESSPTCLRWKVTLNSRSIKDNPAGSYNKTSNYSQVTINSRAYMVHRVVACLHNNDITGMVIDHIDGNSLNNKISNLKVCSQLENSRNRRILKSNTTGTTGVKYNARQDRFVASWYESGKQIERCFSVLKLGYDEALKQAIACRKEAEEKLGVNSWRI